MIQSEVDEIARRWLLQHSQPHEASAREPSIEPSIRLSELIDDDPESAWQVIVRVLEREPADLILANLAAGPLEDLLAKHGGAFIERIEIRARQSPILRKTLGAVWKNIIPDDVWDRVRKVAGPSF